MMHFARHLMEFSVDDTSAIETLLYKSKLAEECQGKNIMVCKGCTSENMTGMSRNVWAPNLESWCFDRATFTIGVRL